MMVENKGKSLPKIAVELEIHVSTAFYWRHKILNALRSLGHTVLSGIVESDEQISVVVSLDRNGSILSKLAGRGRITASQINDVMGESFA